MAELFVQKKILEGLGYMYLDRGKTGMQNTEHALCTMHSQV